MATAEALERPRREMRTSEPVEAGVGAGVMALRVAGKDEALKNLAKAKELGDARAEGYIKKYSR